MLASQRGAPGGKDAGNAPEHAALGGKDRNPAAKDGIQASQRRPLARLSAAAHVVVGGYFVVVGNRVVSAASRAAVGDVCVPVTLCYRTEERGAGRSTPQPPPHQRG